MSDDELDTKPTPEPACETTRSWNVICMISGCNCIGSWCVSRDVWICSYHVAKQNPDVSMNHFRRLQSCACYDMYDAHIYL